MKKIIIDKIQTLYICETEEEWENILKNITPKFLTGKDK